jgi:molybdopterin molybdotransferase
MKNLTIEDAQAAMLAQVRPLGVETVPIDEAHGRILAEPIDAARDQPPFTASAMDGWAVRAADARDQEALLTVVGESAAGSGYDGVLQPGQAVRIFTGAALPQGADLIEVQENAQPSDGKVRLGPVRNSESFIRPRGGDFKAGARLLDAGMRLDAWRLSLAAAAGCADVAVARRPRVAVLSTGEELVRPPRDPGPWQIYESGSLALCAMVEAWGGVPHRLAPALDTEPSVIEAVSGQDVDLIVTIGGASVGDYDVVKPALGQLGLALFVQSINIRPGKPTWFGRLGDERLVVGLPGNPGSAMVCAQLFLKPVIRAMLGADPVPRFIAARLAKPIKANGPREQLMRVVLREGDDGVVEVDPLSDQDSSLVTVFAQADGLMRRPANAPAAHADDMVQVLRLERL